MATKGAAFQAFAESFGIPAYAATSVPDGAEPPYISYTLPMGAIDAEEAAATLDIWYRTESEALLNRKAQEVSDAVGLGGVVVPCDGGAMWIKRGSPFSQPVQTEPGIKRRLVNLSIEYLTQD